VRAVQDTSGGGREADHGNRRDVRGRRRTLAVARAARHVGHVVWPVQDPGAGHRGASGDLAGRVRVGKLDVDENPATAARFGVRSIPTLLVLRDGRELDRIVGVQPKPEIARRLTRVLG
jgi:Thioredoxin